MDPDSTTMVVAGESSFQNWMSIVIKLSNRYAMERTSSFARVWFWPRSSNPPFDVSSGGIFVNTDNWGTPSANFPNTSCDLDAHLGQHNIIINLTLCMFSFLGLPCFLNYCVFRW
jgi:hypothetical protein